MIATAAPPRELWAHQAEALAFCEQHPAALLKIGMGGGKTRIAAERLAQPDRLPALVMTRSKVIEDGIWQRELSRVNLLTTPLVGPIDQRAELIKDATSRYFLDDAPVFVTNYEAVWREPLASTILRVPWQTVIADEIQRIKSPGSSVSKFAARLGARVPHRIGLSGTPMAHSPLDLYGEFRFLDPSIFGTSFARFRARYAVMGGFQNHQVIGYQRQDELMRRFWLLTYAAEPVFGIEAVDVPLTHELPASARRLYQELDKEFFGGIGDGTVTIANAAVKVLRLQQVAAGHIRDDDKVVHTVHTARADLLADWLEDVDEPVVVFCRFRHDLDEVRRVAVAAGRGYAEVSGRANELIAWKEGSADILGVQIQAGGEGIDLTRSALAVYFSVGYSLSDYLQSRSRLVRPGQTRPVRFYHLSARGSVDTRVSAALRDRQDVIQSLLNIKQGAELS